VATLLRLGNYTNAVAFASTVLHFLLGCAKLVGHVTSLFLMSDGSTERTGSGEKRNAYGKHITDA